MTDREWIEAFAAALGAAPPDPVQTALILDLAAEAAHASQRTAAPVACWVAAASGRPVEEALAAAREVAGGELS
jgi:Domain of unknown function (DUF6457)